MSDEERVPVLFLAYTGFIVAVTFAAAAVVVVAGIPWRVLKCVRGWV